MLSACAAPTPTAPSTALPVRFCAGWWNIRNSLRATLNISKLQINNNMAYIFYFLGVATGIAVYRFYITHRNLFNE